MRALTLLALLALATLCITGQAGECPHLPSGRTAVGAEKRKHHGPPLLTPLAGSPFAV